MSTVGKQAPSKTSLDGTHNRVMGATYIWWVTCARLGGVFHPMVGLLLTSRNRFSIKVPWPVWGRHYVFPITYKFILLKRSNSALWMSVLIFPFMLVKSVCELKGVKSTNISLFSLSRVVCKVVHLSVALTDPKIQLSKALQMYFTNVESSRKVGWIAVLKPLCVSCSYRHRFDVAFHFWVFLSLFGLTSHLGVALMVTLGGTRLATRSLHSSYLFW